MFQSPSFFFRHLETERGFLGCETPQNTTLRMETKRVTPRLVLYALNPVLHLFCMDLKNKLRPTSIFDRKEYGPFPKNIH